ncbi:MAG: sulfurtransferase TusA family protein [Oleibacter sp.]|nr:sulfurtransferase TusA family protein [Thalassolituus sp.]
MSNLSGKETQLDVSGLQCPMPLLKTKLALRSLAAGDILHVIATDAGSARDIPRYIAMSPHSLLEFTEDAGHFIFRIEKER